MEGVEDLLARLVVARGVEGIVALALVHAAAKVPRAVVPVVEDVEDRLHAEWPGAAHVEHVHPVGHVVDVEAEHDKPVGRHALGGNVPAPRVLVQPIGKNLPQDAKA